MMSYRFKRRAFLAGVGGAVGLHTLLSNLEASAQGMISPPRLLVMFWPDGTIRYHFTPNGTGTSYVTSRILKPFEDAGLREDMIVLLGLTHAGITTLGGANEGGTVMSVTGANSPGTRDNPGEDDDALAGGPSFDQIFLSKVPELGRTGVGSFSAIADGRVDSYETSAACLSYARTTREIQSARPGGLVTEHVPLLPQIRPLSAYTNLFAGFMPGGDNPTNQAALLRAVKLKKSVLDSALRELDQIRNLAPASEREKIDIHADAIRKMEQQLEASLPPEEGCVIPAAPDASLEAKMGSKNDYANPKTDVEDGPRFEQIGKAHLAVIRAAFQCDLLRVAAFQWCPGTNHVSFKGLYPNDLNGSYMHNPMSHKLPGNAAAGPPPSSEVDLGVYEFLTNVHTWFNLKTADVLAEFKGATDAYGGNLLDYTIAPFITDIADTSLARQPLPALIFGGRALGMQGGQFQNFATPRSHNDLWMTIAQAYLKTGDPLPAFADEVFFKQNVAPIPGLWAPPA